MALNPITSNKKMTNNVTKIFPARVLYHGEGSCSIAPINKEWLQYTTILLLSTVPLTPLTVRLYFSILRPSLFTHLSPGYYFPLPTRVVEPGRSPINRGIIRKYLWESHQSWRCSRQVSILVTKKVAGIQKWSGLSLLRETVSILLIWKKRKPSLSQFSLMSKKWPAKASKFYLSAPNPRLAKS